jgi:hypothetical protein
MYFIGISRYIWRLVLSAVSRNRGRFWNVLGLPVDKEGLLYLLFAILRKHPINYWAR